MLQIATKTTLILLQELEFMYLYPLNFIEYLEDAGKFNLERAMTPGKKPYLLLNLPYYLGTLLPHYAEWQIEPRL